MLTMSAVNDHVLKLVGVLYGVGGIKIDTFKKNSPGQKNFFDTPMLTLSIVSGKVLKMV